jgi:hypothetical protein
MRRLLLGLLLIGATAGAQTISVVTVGTQGPQGATGPTGPTGPAPSTYLVKAAPNVATSGTIHEALYTISVPANTLEEVGDALVITAHFSTAANTNTKYGRVTYGNVNGPIIAATVNSASAAAGSVQVMVFRTGASTAVALQPTYYASGNAQLGTQTVLTGLDFSTGMVFVVTGLTASSAGDETLLAVSAYVSK